MSDFPVEEIIVFVLCLIALLRLFVVRSRLTRIPSPERFLFAILAFSTGSLAAVLEQFFWLETFNFIEHLCYLISCGALLLWCHKLLKSGDFL